MPSLNDIQFEQDFYKTFNNFMLTYQQLGAIKMQQIRSSIIQTRRYMDGLADVFVDVQQAHKKLIEQITSRDHKNTGVISFSTFKKNKRSAVVLISPDTKFSGAINRQVFAQFSQVYSQKKTDTDAIIVGTVGEQLFRENFPESEYEAFHIPQALNEMGDLKTLLEKLVNFRRVDIYYPRFFTLVKQQAVITNITGDMSLTKTETEKEKERKDYLFEPKLDTMVRFFELQVFTALLQQTVNESYLANLGSRIVTLESATQSVRKEYEDLTNQYRRLKRHIKNSRQRDQISGSALW